jgi:hydrogenase maturation protein HypF
MLLESPERPIVILNRCYSSEADELASSIAPENRHLGAFLPYTPIHFLLFHDSPYKALVMTSGNQSDEPIVISNQEAREKLKGIAEFFLFHNRDIYMRCDDSVARVLHSGRRSVRRARGFVPVPVFLREPVAPVLGVGAELKNTVCLTRGREAFLSQHIGDLENLETLKSFESTIDHLRKVLSIVPECVIHDSHPDYLSTQWALEQPDVPRIAVQHHHAHIAAVVAERRLSGPVIGMALDGTGYGSDGTIWGGEILLVDGDICERLGHFRQVPLPGGNIAIREPWRMAASYLWSAQPETAERVLCDLLRGYDQAKLKLVLQMLEKRINAPLTSSCGRLFDAVAALVGLPRSGTVNYEGQAAIELEQGIERDDGLYHGKMENQDGTWILDPFPMVLEINSELQQGCSPGLIAARFHNGIIQLLVDGATQVSNDTGIKQIALSGGVFQNAYLSNHLESHLSKKGFDVFGHIEVPTNDGCIALGQAYIGAMHLARSTH